MKYLLSSEYYTRPEGTAVKIEMDGDVATIYETNGNVRHINTNRVEVEIVDDDKPEEKTSKLSKVRYPTSGGDIIMEVAYFGNGFLRDERGLCAFCHGDPCAEDSDETTLIGAYFKRYPNSETCPVCDGRPS